MTIASAETIINDARNGRMFILVDDEDRENEGDLIIPAQMATPDAVNFMATHGRGLICLAMQRTRIEQLGLPPMSAQNESRHSTAFTISIEAKDGISTGISAPDRAHTIATAINPASSAEAIVSPGHVFPLMARDGGVLVRAGHTEAAVDVSRLAGLTPAGVICEIMKDDGTMARMDDLQTFAQEHQLNIGTIADLIAYRLTHDRLVGRVLERAFHSRFGGEFALTLYRNHIDGTEHVALVKGDVQPNKAALVRMHSLNILEDALGDDHYAKGGSLQRAMEALSSAESGVLVLLREGNPTSLSDQLAQRDMPKPNAGGSKDLRDYGIGAQILLDLGVKDMILLTHAKPQIVALEGYGLNITDYQLLSS